jgi:hypothetical protein
MSQRTRRRQRLADFAARQCPSLQNLRGGVGRATDPARSRVHSVEARGCRKHAGQVAALHYGELAVHVGAAGGTLVSGLGKRSVGGFAEELHGAGAEAPRGFK